MERTIPTGLLLAMCFGTLTACSSTDINRGGAMSSSSTMDSAMPSSQSTTGVVQQIEQVAPQKAGVGAGSVASTDVGGTAPASTSTADRIYRITVRLDDGSNQVVTQQIAPDFHSGERIRIVNGVAQRY